MTFTVDEGNTAQSFHPAPNPEPKTNDPGKPLPNQSKLSQTKAQVQRVPDKGIKNPKNSVFRRMSALARFRQSPAYRDLEKSVTMKDTKGKGNPLTQSDDTFTPANLKEKAEAMIEFVQRGGKADNLFRIEHGRKMIVESIDDFADSIISLLIDAGFDENLVEVETKGGSVMVYLDERATAKHKDIQSILAEIGNIELLSEPNDNPELGTFVYKISPHSGKPDANKVTTNNKEYGQKDVSASESVRESSFTLHQEAKKKEDQLKQRKCNGDGTAPQPDTRNKKGKRVLHDKEETVFTPQDEAESADPDFTESLGSNPIPREGDIIIDGVTKIPFRVTKVLSNSKVEVLDNPVAPLPSTIPSKPVPVQGQTSSRQIDVSVIEKGLTSGSMQRIQVESEHTDDQSFTESGEELDLNVCPNCVTPLKQEGSSFSCIECAFVAEYADVGAT